MTLTNAIPLPTRRKVARKADPRIEAGGSLASIVASLSARFTKRELWGAHLFLTDLQADAGTSGNIAACYSERVQSSYKDRGHMVGWTASGDRVQSVLNMLTSNERSLLDFMIRNREMARPHLHQWGKERANYADQKDNGVYTVGQIASLLDRIAWLYEKYSCGVTQKS